MTTAVYKSEFFNIKDTLECGQIFRFREYGKGFLVFSGEKACYAYTEGENTFVISEDEKYFENFFDIVADYGEINSFAAKSAYPVVAKAARLGKGIRILRQNAEETLFSFIVSQNNHIPRIKSCIEKMCFFLGEKRQFMGEEYYTFPSASAIAAAGEKFFAEKGFGYRARYMVECAASLLGGFSVAPLKEESTSDLKKRLTTLCGVGPKVADCVILFGYHRADSFPVDTWIEKLYREDFGGELKDRKKITEFFLNEFGEKSGYVQQYIFYYKRSLPRQ